MLLECIQKIHFEEENFEDEWGLSLSCACCISHLSLIVKDAIIEPVVTFAATQFKKEDWKSKYSALLALGSIAEGPSPDKFASIISPGLANLLAMLGDPSPKVKEVNSWVFTRICEHHAHILHQTDVLKIFLDNVNKLLNDEPKIANHACHIVSNLALSFKPKTGTEF